MFSGSHLTHKRFPSPLKSCIIATALPLLLFIRFRLVYAERCLIKFMLYLLFQIADFQCQMTCSKQGQAATGGTGDREMEFPFACERLCDIKSNLSHLLIVVHLAARQIAASCASSLLPPILEAKLLICAAPR